MLPEVWGLPGAWTIAPLWIVFVIKIPMVILYKTTTSRRLGRVSVQ